MKTAAVVYADGPLVMNALIALGSAKRHNPDASLYLFVKQPERWWFIPGVIIMNVDTAFTEMCPVDLSLWNKWHFGTSGHMYRKVVAWNWILGHAREAEIETCAFLDADTLTEGAYDSILALSRAKGIGGYWEYWQNALKVYQDMTPTLKSELDYFFCGRVSEERIREHKYLNAGVLFLWPTDAIRNVMRDLLRIAVMHPELASHTYQQEQTLLNIALACRGLSGVALNEHGLVQGQDMASGVVLRHWLANPNDRKPSAMVNRHGKAVADALSTLGLDIAMCQRLGLWY